MFYTHSTIFNQMKTDWCKMLNNMFYIKYTIIVGCVSIAYAGSSFQRTGWLDRVVQYHKNNFITDLKKITPVQINATIIATPPGYVDSPGWSYNSVVQLLMLIRASKSAAPVRRALQRALQPSRRFMSVQNSVIYFPSLSKDIPNDIYYDNAGFPSIEEDTKPSGIPDDESLIVVTNPVEARLPSGRISVKLLRDILEARAIAAKAMPTTVRSTIPWIPMNKTASTVSSSDTDATTEAGNITEEGGAETTTVDTPNGNGEKVPENGDPAAPGEEAEGEAGEEAAGEGAGEAGDEAAEE